MDGFIVSVPSGWVFGEGELPGNSSFSGASGVCVCVYVYVCVFVYVCMCIYVCVYVYVFVYVCVYMCMCECCSGRRERSNNPGKSDYGFETSLIPPQSQNGLDYKR